MKKVAVFTGTRADYGILSGLLHKLANDDAFELQLIVSGSHLSPEFGLTYQQIEQDGFNIAAKVECLLSSDSKVGVAKGIGLATISLADTLSNLKPDCIILLGDRFELLAAAQTALILQIPIVHLHGGEITEGAVDDVIRHAITKMAWLHFVATESYRNRVIQLGESPERVFNVGALGVDNILSLKPVPLSALITELSQSLSSPYCVFTYHPATAANESPADTANNILSALMAQPNLSVLATYPNADEGGRQIISVIQQFQQQFPSRIIIEKSLGFKRYISAVYHSEFVIGNSSSAIIEVPSLKTATINVGDRQKGRISAEAVIDVGTDQQSISKAIEQCLSQSFKQVVSKVVNPYGQGQTADTMVKLLKQNDFSSAQKSFYNLNQ